MNLGKKIENKGKKILIKLILKLLPINSANEKFSSKKIKKVIIVRIDERLGNLIFINPVINSFLKAKKDVTLVIPKKFSELFLLNKNFHKCKIIYFEKKKLFNPLNFLSLIFKLRKEEFDLLFDATNPNNLSSLALFVMLIIKARYKVGFKRKNSEHLLNIIINRPEGRVHILKYYKLLFNAIKIKFYPDLKFEIPSKYKNKLNKLKKEFKNYYLLGVHPGGRGLKQFPPEKLKIVILKILKRFKNIKILLFIGPNEKNTISLFKNIERVEIIIPSNIIELAIYMKLLNIYIGNDSGPIHLAEGFNLKLIGIYKPDAAIVFKPTVSKYKMIITPSPYTLNPEILYKSFLRIYKK